MSFSNDIKTALSKSRMSDCCALAECYGMLLFSRTFSPDDISFTTENSDAAEVFSKLMRRLFDCRIKISQSGNERKRYKAFISGDVDKKRVLNEYTRNMGCNFENINGDKLSKSCCMSAFLRGVFLACGSISDPKKQYRLEFVVKNNSLAVDLYSLLYRRGINPYMSSRGKYVIVYIKKSEDIEDFLTAIEAPKFSLEFIGVSVIKDIRNNENRKNNFETANIVKTSNAALIQTTAIEKLKKDGKLGLLPKELIDIANLRLQNPESSLTELLNIYNSSNKKQLTRSGLNHRISKLIELSKQ